MREPRATRFRSSLRRAGALARADFGWIVGRPLFWAWIAVFGLTAYYFIHTGRNFLYTGSNAAGSQRAFVTSEFAVADDCALLSILLSTFFACVIAGLTPIQDDDSNIGSVLHATPLRVAEYVWGKFAAIMAVCGLVALVQVGVMLVFYHLLPFPEASAWRGPLDLSNYLVPMLAFTLPYLIFLASVSYAAASAFRQPVLVFVLPFVLLIAFSIYLAISLNLSDTASQTIPLTDPSGFVWLRETYLVNDRGTTFYNTTRIVFTPEFVVSRLVFVAVGLLSVAFAQLRVARAVRSPSPWLVHRSSRNEAPAAIDHAVLASPDVYASIARSASLKPIVARLAPISALQMRGRRPGLWRAAITIARGEMSELRRQPGLYIFVPAIAFMTASGSIVRTGLFSTRRILTSGFVAASAWDSLSLFVAMLLLAYTVEILERDRATGLTALENALPVRTGSILLGKFLALCVVAVLPLLATAGILALVMSGERDGGSFSLGPFALLWGALLCPSLVAWIAFVMAVYVITGHSRYQTYAAAGLVLLVISNYSKTMSWVYNLFLLGAMRWTDLAPLEFDKPTLVLSRLLAISAAVFWFAVAWRLFQRRDLDSTRRINSFNLRAIGRATLRLAPFAVAPLALGFYLQQQIDDGDHGAAARQKARDYWQRNVGTWPDLPLPGISDVKLAVDLFPERRAYNVKGTLTLTNYHAFPLLAIPLTPYLQARNLRWTLDGKPYRPENRAALYIITPPNGSLRPGESVRVGFSWNVPAPGPTTNGVGNVKDSSTHEFLVPSAVLLTSFSNRLLPKIGYDKNLGIDTENTYNGRDPTVASPLQENGRALFGSATPFALHLTVTAPDDFIVNSTGACTSQTFTGDRRTDVWDCPRDPWAPIRCFAIVGGRNLAVLHGVNDTSIYYYAGHGYNAYEMLNALDDAHSWYGAWFGHYPWADLKLTEFPDYHSYAEGLPTNITFSEGMGFLTRGTEHGFEADTDAFAVTAHEAAHQWWGNLVTPGNGPGSDVLSEGMAHYSAAMLIERIKGYVAREHFLKQIEWEYNRDRSVDSELPIVRMTGSNRGDTAVVYDKGGWVLTMLSENVMGRDNMLAGLREFVTRYRSNNDHPNVPDLLATLRPFAPDKTAFDAFVDQWFYHVVLPEFQVAHAKATRNNQLASTGSAGWDVSFDVQNIGSGRIETPIAVIGFGGRRALFKRMIDSRDARSTHFTFPIDFEPTYVYIDPFYTILQRNRRKAWAKL